MDKTQERSGEPVEHRKRDRALIEFLHLHHVGDTEDFVFAGIFPNEDVAGKRCRKLEEREVIRVAGMSRKGIGRPRKRYATRQLKADLVDHEHELTKALIRLKGGVTRGNDVDQKYRPDAEVQLKYHYFVELDRANETVQFVKKRFETYRHCEEFVLWIVPTQARLESLRKNAEAVAHNALFATYDQVLKHPFDKCWTDYYGDKTSIR